jgi:predicted nuclease of predicted toxin-antitoxin system
VTILAHPLLADENIDPDVVAWLREAGCDVRTVFEEGLAARSDVAILRHARAAGRVVLTHDSDFGQIALRGGEPLVGIVYIRPGHRAAAFTIGTLVAVLHSSIDIEPPFIAVAERRATETRVRVRRHFAL